MPKNKIVRSSKIFALSIFLFLSAFGPVFSATVTLYGTSGSSDLASDGQMTSGYRATMDLQHTATSGDGQSPTGTYVSVRALRNGSGYYVARAWLGFDVSDLIDEGAVIDSATLVLYKDTGPGFVNDSTSDIAIVPFASPSANPPYTTDFNYWFDTATIALYGDELVTPVPFSDFSTGNGTNLFFTASGISYLTNGTNGGFIRLGIVTDLDRDYTAFTSGQDNILGFSSADNSNSALRPQLRITYHIPGQADNPSLATSSLVNFSYVASSTTAFASTSCATFDLGCYIVNGLAYLFVPSSDSVSQFQYVTFASSS